MAAVVVLVGVQSSAGATHARTLVRRRHHSRHRPRPHQPIGRPQRSRSDRRGGGASGPEVRRLHRSRRRDARHPIRPPIDPASSASTRSKSAPQDGHYLALDMPAAPYPLGGDARGVVEDVKRLGGFGVVAHPNSPKPDLSWDDWDAPFDAIEWLNPDTSWRLKVASARMAIALEHRRRAGRLSVPVARNHRAPHGRHGARRRADGSRSRTGGASCCSPAPTRTRGSR